MPLAPRPLPLIKWVAVLIASLLLGQQIIAGGCADQSTTLRGTFKIGLVAPFSGINSTVGYNMLFAAKLAIGEWNESDRLKGYRVELLAQDDRNESASALTQARKMVLDGEVLGVVGHPSNPSALAVAGVYSGAGLAMITTEASADALSTGDYPGVFRLSASDGRVQAETLRFVTTTLKAQKLAVVAEPKAEHARYSERLVERMRADGFTLAFGELLKPEQVEFSDVARRIAAGAPQAVFFKGDYVNAGSLLNQLRLQRLSAAYLMNAGSPNALFLRVAGNSAEGAYLISPAPNPTDVPSAASFVQAFRAFSGQDPLPSAMLTYDAVNLILTAVEHGQGQGPIGEGPDRKSVVQSLVGLRDYAGLSSTITFDAKGGVLAPMLYFYRITGQRFPGELQGIANAG